MDNFKTASSHKIPNHGYHPPSVQPLSGPVTHKGAKLAMNNNDPEFSNTHQFTHPKMGLQNCSHNKDLSRTPRFGNF